ncbi:hypothetical protein [Amycolatopsis arida]|nr:hypothetical protein [Amycolatopsis arida]
MLTWWMRFLGCSEVIADVWQGPDRPPGFDQLLALVRPGDEVRVPAIEMFGPTRSHARHSTQLLQRRGVLVVVMREEVPYYPTYADDEDWPVRDAC